MKDVTFPRGFSAFGMSVGIKKNGKPDLGVLISEPPAQAFGAFTRNAVQAAPVQFCRQVLNFQSKISHVLVNSGNANACTGPKGFEDVLESVAALKEAFSCQGEVMVSSTGVIGELLPMEKVKTGIRRLAAKDGAMAPFVEAIMTTDTFAKTAQASITLGGKEVRIGGVAKGAGMIRPDMATMLAYITTDIALPYRFRESFLPLVDATFNSISVDGDMSTNDTCLVLSNGASGVAYEDLPPWEQAQFDQALKQVLQALATSIVRDGEGATKLITIHIRGANTVADARAMAQAIANSPLVKTAFFGNDANWGRVIAAAGSTTRELDTSKAMLDFCGVRVFDKGRIAKVDDADLTERMKQKDVELTLDLGLGAQGWTYWTCDLSYDYVKINGSYRS
jgi:glutamate N-acetyltransferase / amino-acid N-acetyltransferase